MSVTRLARWTKHYFIKTHGVPEQATGIRVEGGTYRSWDELAVACVETEREARDHEGETDDEVANSLLKRVGVYSS